MTINYHTVVKLPAKTGIPADAVENTFSWTMPGVLLLTDITEIHSALAEFYNTAPAGGTHPVSGWLSPTIDRGALKGVMTTYEIPAVPGPLGAPVDVSTFTIGGAIPGNGFPSELACALSFHGDYAGVAEFGTHTRPRARHRGRIYIGPLVNATAVYDIDGTTGRASPSAGLRFDLAAVAARLRDRVNSVWAVWSRTDNTLYPVLNGWVDDAFDIQRRRGEKAISRTTF